MTTGRWNEPITFETQNLGQYRTIASAAEAARVLLEDWPVEGGIEYLRAKAVCLTVLSGEVEPDLSREAFLRAAEEAGVFVRPANP